MPTRFAHTLTFICPECKRDIAVTRATDSGDAKSISGQTFHVQCEMCGNSREVPGYLAKDYSVKKWHVVDD